MDMAQPTAPTRTATQRHAPPRDHADPMAAVQIVAGLEPTATVLAALEGARPDGLRPVRLEPSRSPPATTLFLRLETDAGAPLNAPGTIDAHWHRPPYTLAVRLVRHAAGATAPVVVDEAVIGTRGSRPEFRLRVERVATRMVTDAMRDASRGPCAGSAVPHPARRMGGWFDHTRARWHARLLSEWWSVGSTTTPLSQIVRTGALGEIDWLSPKRGARYLADPFPWPGTDRLLCEEMPMDGGHGRIVALCPATRGAMPSEVVLETPRHHSYPCTFLDGNDTYLLPEDTAPGATTLYRLGADASLTPVCAIAENRRLADSTLFRHDGRYWIACTDLDVGGHDNLCLLHARRPEGPWLPHRLMPARIDVRGARPAGSVFAVDGVLYRPGQDCAATYGAGITIHRIDTLTPEEYRETAVTTLRPDPRGPFPHGLHTLVSDGARTWVDGKRFVLDGAGLMRKIGRRLWPARTEGAVA